MATNCFQHLNAQLLTASATSRSDLFNVARMSRVISRVGITSDGDKISQIVYYQAGVATGDLAMVDKARQGALGKGLAENVCEAYNFIANNWGPGDEIFIFGFSRGAYTARALAGFICQIGVLPATLLDSFYEIYTEFKDRKVANFEDTPWANGRLVPGELGTMPPKLGDTTKRDQPTRIEYLNKVSHMHAKIKVVGVWDTVGSLTAFNWWDNWYGVHGKDKTFHTTKLNPKIENAFHALAIDESRGNFPATMWYLDSSCYDEQGKPKVNLKQCWFPGYHSDVGGHSQSDVDTNSVDEIAFAWMCDQLHGLLQLSSNALQRYVLLRLIDLKLDTSNQKLKHLRANWKKISWTEGTLDDTNAWLEWWWIASAASTGSTSIARTPGQGIANEIVHGKSQRIPYGQFNEEVHPSVAHRIGNSEVQKYRPYPFRDGQGWTYQPPTRTTRGHWSKGSGDEMIILNEYIIPEPKESPKAREYDHWQSSLERTFAPSEVLTAQAPFKNEDCT